MSKEFNDEIDFYINNYPENKNVLENIKEIIKEIDKKLGMSYTLYFIAEKGAGKTTIICNITNLTYIKEKIHDKTKKKYEVIEEVLETGSGATTTSEVELCAGENSYTIIKIIPHKYEDVIEMLKTFAKLIFNNVHNIEDGKKISMPTEIIRACRNMTRLTENKKNREDFAKELALNYNLDSYSEYEAKVIELANLDNRIKTEFLYDYKEGKKSEKEWIKNIFKKINLVHIDEAPIPKKVVIKINKDIFDFSKLKKINKIVDTRGLEAGSVTDRSDMKRIFREEENSIILLVDKFNSPSKSLIDLMSHYVYDDNMDWKNRIGYIVNFKDGEPEKVIDCNGKVDNEVDGIYEKMNQTLQIFRENEINISANNIVYVNPRRFLNAEGKVKIEEEDYDIYDFCTSKEDIIKYKKGIIEKEKEDFQYNIINIIEEYEVKLKENKKEILERYEKIKSEIEKGSLLEIKNITDTIKSYVLSVDLVEKCKYIYTDYIEGKYPSVLMAINKRHGIYDYNDIFCEGANFIERSLKDIIKNFKNNVIKMIQELKENKNLNNNQISSIDLLINEINRYFFKYVEILNNYFYEKLKNEIYSDKDVEFWDKVKGRWGKGAGYRKDINKYYKDNIINKSFNYIIDEDAKNLLNSLKIGVIDIINKVSK